MLTPIVVSEASRWRPDGRQVAASAAVLALWVLMVWARVPWVSEVAAFLWPYVLMLGLERWVPVFTFGSWSASIALTALCSAALLSISRRLLRTRSALWGIAAAVLGMALASGLIQLFFPRGE